jgi:hypothetical protein
MRGIVIRKFRKRKERYPVILLVIAIESEVLLEDLVNPLGLPVRFRMVGGRVVAPNVQELTEGSPELGDKEFSAVGNQ